MTNALISTVVAAAATFIAAGFVIQFAVGGSQAAQEELRGGVQIDNKHAFYQLVMYDSLIAYNCDDTAAAGLLDGTGDKHWDDWKTYKMAAAKAQENPGNIGNFRFTELNNSFGGNQLRCYGTGTSIGGKGISEAINPSSREWRNDQEGEHSRIRFTINGTPTGQDHFWVGPCFWFDQPANTNSLAVPGDSDNPDKGWSNHPEVSGGITDMAYYFTDSSEVNHFDYWVDNKGCQSTNNWESSSHRYEFRRGGNTNSHFGSTGMTGGPLLTVTMINNAGISSLVQEDIDNVQSNGDVPGPDNSHTIETSRFKLCKGTRGYIQTNTGYTTEYDYVADDYDYINTPAGEYGPSGFDQPGHPDKEKFSDQNDNEDNSLHPFIVIEKYTC